MDAPLTQRLDGALGEIFREGLRNGYSVRTKVRGGWMYPLIKGGDVITVRPMAMEEARIGDILVYAGQIHDGLTAHRLLEKRRDAQGRKFLLSKGDANRYFDFRIYGEEVLGKVTMIERTDGRILRLDKGWRPIQGYLIAQRARLAVLFRRVLGPFQRAQLNGTEGSSGSS